MPPRRAKKASTKQAKPRRPAKRATRPKAKKQSARTQPFVLAPIPDEVFAKHVLPLLEPDALVQLLATSKSTCARLGASDAIGRVARLMAGGTAVGEATRCVIGAAYGVSMPADADPLDWAKRLHRWTRHQQHSDDIDSDIAGAFACGTIPCGLADGEFFGPGKFSSRADHAAFHDRAERLAELASVLTGKKRFAPRAYDIDDDVVYKDLQVGEDYPDDLEEVEQSVEIGVQIFAKRVMAYLKVNMTFGDECGASTFDWKLRVSLDNGLTERDMWCGSVGYGDASDGVAPSRTVDRATADVVSDALGLPRSRKALMGFLLYLMGAPFRWEATTNATGAIADVAAEETGTMLLLIRHHMWLALADEQVDEDEWEDGYEERYNRKLPLPPRGFTLYCWPKKKDQTRSFGWWMGKHPPRVVDEAEPARMVGTPQADDDADADDAAADASNDDHDWMMLDEGFTWAIVPEQVIEQVRLENSSVEVKERGWMKPDPEPGEPGRVQWGLTVTDTTRGVRNGFLKVYCSPD